MFGLLLLWMSANGSPRAAEPTSPTSVSGESLLREYFRLRTAEIAAECLSSVKTAEDWEQQRGERYRELQDMLGLSPWPEKTPLEPVITGTLEREDLIIEKLHFQSQPGLYVTANFYRPKVVTERLPAILYVCGHAVVKENGVSMGNKTAYQNYGVWFAQNGYVCLIVDTIQLGEISGIHHGTNLYGMWWWLNRGYTPAGVEVWNGIRAIDYLQSRPEVDPDRIGVSGRSGGGAMSWYIAAMDERIKAAVPASGFTIMYDHIVGKCVNGHCDCMYMVNRYGWDFPMVAALIAPRPLMILNDDRDKIFPLEGVVDLHSRTRQFYKLLDVENNTGIVVWMGAHEDTQHGQNAALEWFNRHLKGMPRNQRITTVPTHIYKHSELKVFEQLPRDETVTTAHEWFNQPEPSAPGTRIFQPSRIGLKTSGELQTKLIDTRRRDGKRLREFEFESEDPYRLPFLVLDSVNTPAGAPVTVHVLTPDAADQRFASLKSYFDGDAVASETVDSRSVQVFFAPRGVGKTRWNDEPKDRWNTRRSLSLLGTTEDERRGIDTANALAAIRSVLGTKKAPVTVIAEQHPAFWSLYAALVIP